ncbi:General transcription factor IIH subunit 5 [Cichlidogyrus casuarinus]|uniref:General transcription and DNA repair factor IIH subunit TFB5 n=1 Tax=Cichlidogyrus casuarinus TaxID=1844966 RepID=A0ABD2QD72_9PLAT
MVNVHKGVLVKCDPSMKQFLVHLSETLVFGTNFVHMDLDDCHLFIDPEVLPRLQDRIDTLMESLSFPMIISNE